MRRGVIASLVVALAAILGATQALAQDHGIRVVAIDQLAQPGQARVRAEVLDPGIDSTIGNKPGAGDFALKLNDGEGRILRIQRAADLQLRTHTIVAIDHSQSFKGWGWADEGWDFAERAASKLGPKDTVSLQLFSETVEAFPSRSSAADFRADLAKAKATDWGRITRLYSSLIRAIDAAATENPLGFNRIYMLTDGDEESETYQWQEVADAAKARGVQVFIVLYPPNLARMSAADRAKLPTLLDNLIAIADATGGEQFEHKKAKPSDTLDKVDEWQRRAARYLAVQGRLCGLTKDSSDNSVFVDYAPGSTARKAWSDGFEFDEWGSTELFDACDPTGPTLDCASWQQPDAAKTKCVAKSCTTDADCGAGATCDAGKCAPGSSPSAGIPSWLWWVVGGLGFLLLLVLILLAARRGGDRVERVERVEVKSVPGRSPTPPPQPAPGPDPAPGPGPVGVLPVGDALTTQDPLPYDLPRTFLVVKEGGRFLKDPRYAIYDRDFQIGAVQGSGNKLVVEHPRISGAHCTIQVFPRGDIWIRDESSTNGTFVDGVRVPKGQKVKAEVGSRIRLGPEVTFEIERPGAPSPRKRPTLADDGPAPAKQPPPIQKQAPVQGEAKAAAPRRPAERQKAKTRISGTPAGAPPQSSDPPGKSPGDEAAARRRRDKKKTRISE
jgi:pSer/pThr/pTyr-binding forkhead associated (FHA) protein